MKQTLKLYIEGSLVHTEYLKLPKLSAYTFKKRVLLKEEMIKYEIEKLKLMYPDTAFREYYIVLSIEKSVYESLPVIIK